MQQRNPLENKMTTMEHFRQIYHPAPRAPLWKRFLTLCALGALYAAIGIILAWRG